jgi:hypothetical protein
MGSSLSLWLVMTSSKIGARRGENPKRVDPESTFALLQYSIPDKRLEQTSRLDDDDELKSDLSQQRLKGKNAKEKKARGKWTVLQPGRRRREERG